MVYDVFMFFDELDLLEIRLNILNPVVDYFVITEADVTQSGIPKKMIFEENWSRFESFRDKIIYNPIYNSEAEFDDQWQRERYQKNACIEGIKRCKDDDVVLFSDMDEIPNPKRIKEVLANYNDNIIYHFAQEMFYFFINYKNVDGSLIAACGEFPGIKDKKWLGSKLCSFKMLSEIGCDNLRHRESIKENSIRINDGGWHFSYMGGTKKDVQARIKGKLDAFSHQEYNKWRYYNRLNIWLSIKLGRDLLGRGAKFSKVPIDQLYPEWLREHYREYPHFVL